MIKLLIGGSPCTHWSIAQTKNRETEPSGLGWELFSNYKIARDKYQPDYFLYENNKSMSPAIRAQITKELGVEPVLINSALVSAQNRQRLYWAGKRNLDGTYSQVDVGQPEDRGILLRDILDSGTCWREKSYTLKANYAKAGAVNAFDGGHFPAPIAAEPINVTSDGKAQCLRATCYKDGIRNMVGNTVDRKTCVAEPVRIGTIESDTKNADFDSQQYRVYSPDGKSVTLCGQGGGVGAKTGLYAAPVCINQLASGKSRTVDAHMGRLEKNLVPRMNDSNPAKQQYDCIVQAVRVGTYPSPDGTLGNSQSRRIYSTDGKSPSICASQSGGNCDTSSPATRLYAVPFCEANYELIDGADILIANGKIRQGDDKGSKQGKYVYTELTEKANTISAGQAHNEKVLVPASDGKWKTIYEVRDGQITIKDKQYPIKLADGFYIIRKVTVTECKRLQTVPDDYIFPVSDTQAYKMLGNGWTVDVIAHIMSHFDGITTEPVEVMSMYDGMSCGHIALDKLMANVTRYYATEIDKYAIKTTQHNYPDTIQLGDAFQVRDDGWTLPERGGSIR